MAPRVPTAQQRALFPSADPLAGIHADAAALAARLPPRVYLGTSSWNFPGWRGLVYSDVTGANLSRDGLTEYARHPLFQTVGIDRGYYAPVPEADLGRYAGQVPAGFRFCLKAPAAITSAVLPHAHGRAPEANPDYLSPTRFIRDLADPVRRALGDHAGPIIVELPPVARSHRPTPGAFAERLDRFLAGLPRGLWCAVELRDADLLTAEYLDVLHLRRAAHVYNAWRAMPSLAAQAVTVPVAQRPFALLRLMLPPGGDYEDRKRSLAPFDQVRDPQPAILDEAAELVRTAHTAGRAVFVLASNKLEGCAPGTVRALATRLAGRAQTEQPEDWQG